MKINTENKFFVVFTTEDMRMQGSYVAVAMFDDWREAQDFELQKNEALTDEDICNGFWYETVSIYDED